MSKHANDGSMAADKNINNPRVELVSEQLANAPVARPPDPILQKHKTHNPSDQLPLCSVSNEGKELQQNIFIREDTKRHIKMSSEQSCEKCDEKEREIDSQSQPHENIIIKGEKHETLESHEISTESKVLTTAPKPKPKRNVCVSEEVTKEATDGSSNTILSVKQRDGSAGNDETVAVTVQPDKDKQSVNKSEKEQMKAPLSPRFQESSESIEGVTNKSMEEMNTSNFMTPKQSVPYLQDVKDEVGLIKQHISAMKQYTPTSIFDWSLQNECEDISKSFIKETQHVNIKDDFNIMKFITDWGFFRIKPKQVITLYPSFPRFHPVAIGDIPWSWLREEKWRLHTYTNYPVNTEKSAILLASEGFAYYGSGTGDDDTVICCFCYVTKRGWLQSDVIEDVHRAMSPECPVVTGVNNNNVSMKPPQAGNSLFRPLHESYGHQLEDDVERPPSETPEAAHTVHGRHARQRQVLLPQQSNALPSHALPFVQHRNGLSLPQARNGLPLPQARNGLPLPQARNGLPLPQARNGLLLPQARNGLPPAQQRNDLSPPHHRNDLSSPQQRNTPSSPQQRNTPSSSQQRNGMSTASPATGSRATGSMSHGDDELNDETDSLNTSPTGLIRHPEYADRNRRLSSFPSNFTDNVRQALASGGFFYEDSNDVHRLSCFYCGFSRFNLDNLQEDHRDTSRCPVSRL